MPPRLVSPSDEVTPRTALSVLALFYYLRLGKAVYIAPAQQTRPVEFGHATWMAIGLCAACVVLMGVFPAVFIEPALDAASVLIAGIV